MERLERAGASAPNIDSDLAKDVFMRHDIDDLYPLRHLDFYVLAQAMLS